MGGVARCILLAKINPAQWPGWWWVLPVGCQPIRFSSAARAVGGSLQPGVSCWCSWSASLDGGCRLGVVVAVQALAFSTAVGMASGGGGADGAIPMVMLVEPVGYAPRLVQVQPAHGLYRHWYWRCLRLGRCRQRRWQLTQQVGVQVAAKLGRCALNVLNPLRSGLGACPRAVTEGRHQHQQAGMAGVRCQRLFGRRGTWSAAQRFGQQLGIKRLHW